jgi:environmental stress-induced protein Ves
MSIQIKKQSEITSNRWAAGTTSELFIWPNQTSFEARDFDFRISTATVEQTETTFTKFNGYSRELMILAGRLQIHHENLYSKTLNTFDVDSFEGDWDTNAEGMVTDFNIIYRGKVLAKLESNALEIEQIHKEEVVTKNSVTLIYIWDGAISITTLDDKTSTANLAKGDCVILQYDQSPESISLQCINQARIIVARIWY